MTLSATDVRWHAGGTVVIDGIDLAVEPGTTVGLLGPNGSGKSSLLRLLAGLRPTTSGVVRLDDREIGSWGRAAVAHRLAVVEQQSSTELDLTVGDVVGLGRTPHRGRWGPPRAEDTRAVTAAAELVGVDHLLGRAWQSLSGGERQRTQLARALAQEPRELLLDEPTNHLDIGHQLEILALVRRLPVTTVVALHDLNLAAQFCDTVAVLVGGRVRASGPPAEVLTTELVTEVYGVRAVLHHDDGGMWIRFLPGD